MVDVDGKNKNISDIKAEECILAVFTGIMHYKSLSSIKKAEQNFPVRSLLYTFTIFKSRAFGSSS